MIDGNYTGNEVIVLVVIALIAGYWISWLIHSYNPTKTEKGK